MKKHWLFFGLFLLLAGPASAEYQVGEEPPDFGCNDTYGNPWTLYEHRGKVMVVNFGATW